MINIPEPTAAGAPLPTAEWITLDIETVAGRPEAADEWMRWHWEPSQDWKPETIGKRYLEGLEKKRERLALMDAAEIVIVALRTDQTTTLVHCGKWPGQKIGEAEVIRCDDAKTVLATLRTILALICDPETLIVGHNIQAFDLPKLRNAYLRHKLALPPPLLGDQPVFDTMREYCRRWSVDAADRAMIGLGTLLEKLGMPNHKAAVDGADVAKLWAQGLHEELLTYALMDVRQEAEVFLRLMGRSGALE